MILNKNEYIENILTFLSDSNFYNTYPPIMTANEILAVEELCESKIMTYLGGPVDGSRKTYELLWDDRPITLACAQDKVNYGNCHKEIPKSWKI